MKDNTSLQTYKNYTNGVFDRDKAILNAKKAKCEIITTETILNVPIPQDFFGEYSWLNDIIKSTSIVTLSESRGRTDDYTYGEVGHAIIIKDANIYNRIICDPVFGKYKEVMLINGSLVMTLREHYKNIQGALICVHNHPGNSSFSYNDIVHLLSCVEVGAIAVVGNTSWLYVLSKNTLNVQYYKKIASNMRREFAKRIGLSLNEDQVKHEIAKNFLENCNNNGFTYSKYKRR
ncbi:hypothetical protein SAMN04487928_13812 [Butyrivibrio proteoclasticus]|uniref:RadC-like JAB domain-containing protein n=1 Tax=Butyrivibrio proteoclasticus TaxID=43305 RepID=A0A1I5XWJ3_9FIRM|nr:hypothetical protein [Butyrivibrio proteoclasticus]SFQ36323.1 hypothetical protein SAMN04487928_13812 [Butyrivibrio proteoclasticus]